MQHFSGRLKNRGSHGALHERKVVKTHEETGGKRISCGLCCASLLKGTCGFIFCFVYAIFFVLGPAPVLSKPHFVGRLEVFWYFQGL